MAGYTEPNQMQEERRAEQGGHDPQRQLRRPHEHACDHVGKEHQGGAKERTAGQDDAMVGAGKQPDKMRHDDPDKADDARDGHGRARGRGGGRNRHALHAVDVDAEVKGLCLPQHQAVEAAHQPRHDEGERQGKRCDGQCLGPAGAGQAAQHPQGQVAQLLIVAGMGEQSGQRRRQRGQRDAGQQQRADGKLPVPGGHCHQQQGGQHAAAKGRER
jgi:hypothetical protein